ncbi:MAG: phosphate acyltransferase PlsX [Oscillospiraceae bacterium]|nr:phosphate acyltransferase PlsX [Oscillospiraceae bacterium]
MKILIDAMGGDNAPEQIVLGALDAAGKTDADIVLVGAGSEILKILKLNGVETLPQGIEIANAEDVVDMHDDPASVIKKRPQSSMIVGLRMLAAGEGDAFISAGSTGALLTAATLLVKRCKGVRRAALGPVLPTKTGKCVLMDCGANAECTPEFLLQFACMGSFYAETLLKIEKPRVALLNIGAEDTKGGTLQKEAYALLKAAKENGTLNFIGNLEARDALLGSADVLVADGFSGNVLLKSVEGTAIFLGGKIKELFMKNALTQLAALFIRGGLRDFKKLLDYRETGGTVFIGLQKPVVKAHGSSDRRAIENAIYQAIETVKADLPARISENAEMMLTAKEKGNV